MKSFIHTYSERLANPYLELIDFNLVATNTFLAKMKVSEEFWCKETFRYEVKQKLKTDVIFKKKFIKYFPEIYEEIQKMNEQKQNHLRK